MTGQWRSRASRVLTLEVTDVTRGADVTVTCKAPRLRLPFKSKRVDRDPRRHARASTKLFKRRWLPGRDADRRERQPPRRDHPGRDVRDARGGGPKRTDRCVAPGAPAAAAC